MNSMRVLCRQNRWLPGVVGLGAIPFTYFAIREVELHMLIRWGFAAVFLFMISVGIWMFLFPPWVVKIGEGSLYIRTADEIRKEKIIPLDSIYRVDVERHWEESGDGVGLAIRLIVETRDGARSFLMPILDRSMKRVLAEIRKEISK